MKERKCVVFVSELIKCDNVHKRVFCEKFENASLKLKLCTDLRMF